MTRSFRPLLLVAALLAPPLAAEPVTVTPVTATRVTAAGQPIPFPAPGAQVIAARYAIAPGARLPVHKHPHPRMAYVLAGTLVVTDAESGAETTYEAGQFVVEMVDRWHWGRNDGDVAVELLVLDMGPEGEPNTVLQQPN